jgi:hypothetical protein
MKTTNSSVYYHPTTEVPRTSALVKLSYEHKGVEYNKKSAAFKKGDDLQLRVVSTLGYLQLPWSPRCCVRYVANITHLAQRGSPNPRSGPQVRCKLPCVKGRREKKRTKVAYICCSKK